MCPPSRARRVAAVLLFAVITAASSALRAQTTAPALPPAPAPRPGTPAADDALEDFLDELGLARLLCDYLERRLRAAPPDRRDEIATRLAEVYAALLENAESAEEQRTWARRSRELLAAVPEADSADLRLSLARAAYRRAERTAERARLRLAPPDETAIALQRFDQLATEFRGIAADAHQRVIALERQEEAGRGDTELLQVALGTARSMRSQAHYLAGWSTLYIAELGNRPQAAAKALEHFGWLLNAKPGASASLERLPHQLLRYPHVARAAIACALATAIRGDTRTALRWLDAVANAESIAPDVLPQLLSRRMQILARAGRWEDVADLIAISRVDRWLPTSDARLLAVLTLEADPGPPDEPRVTALRTLAIADLIDAGELGHALDLARRYGADRLGDDTFIASYIRGLIAYDDAREAHRAASDPDRPAADPSIVSRYRTAASQFGFAVDQPDADRLPGVRANARSLRALAAFYAAGTSRDALAAAADHFLEAAADANDPAKAADALWMAIRALDLALEVPPGPDDALAARRDRLIDRFLGTYPDNDRAGALLLRRAIHDGDHRTASADTGLDPAERLQLLLEIPESSPLHETASRHAARIAYDLYRDATPADRDWLALRYVEIAEPVLAVDRRAATAGDAQAAARAAVRARRIVEALLGMQAPDLARAERALDVLLSLIAGGMVDDGPIAAEIDYRRAQIALARGDAATAEAITDRLQQLDPRFASAASRLFYRAALADWRRARSLEDPDEARDVAGRLIKHGARLIREYSAGDSPLDDPAVVSLYANVADAAAARWILAGDEVNRDRGLLLYRELLRAHPTNAAFLRGYADLAHAAGDHEAALGAWRTLLAGFEPGSDDWFEAKVNLLLLLAEADPQRARVVFDQHQTLYPDLGPEPWGDMLRDIDRRLPAGGAP